MSNPNTRYILGAIFMLASLMVLVLASYGTTLEEQDCTVIFLLAPLGLYLIFAERRASKESAAGEAATSGGGKVNTSR